MSEILAIVSNPREPGLIRYSAILRALRANGSNALADRLVSDVGRIGRTCVTHGLLDDPVIGIVQDPPTILVGCPWCSGVEVLRAWTEQGTEARA